MQLIKSKKQDTNGWGIGKQMKFDHMNKWYIQPRILLRNETQRLLLGILKYKQIT